MATPLRYALIFLLWAVMAAIYAPLILAVFTLATPAMSLTNWLALFADPQLPQALLATLVSTSIAAVGALLIALLVIVALWPGAKWLRLCARLPWLLAIPHVAFAASVLLLFAEGGLVYDYFPFLTPLMDRYGIGLDIALAVKESAFLLWILSAVLSEKRLLQQVIVLDSLGYNRWQCLNWLLLPSVAPALAMAMLAVVAWSLSVVDVAIILGPGNPPTLAVISWQWLTQGDTDQQTKGALACCSCCYSPPAFCLAIYCGAPGGGALFPGKMAFASVLLPYFPAKLWHSSYRLLAYSVYCYWRSSRIGRRSTTKPCLIVWRWGWSRHSSL